MMNHILIIGQPSAHWESELSAQMPDELEYRINAAKLPSHGIRLMLETQPDVIVVVDNRGGQRMEALLAALRKRTAGNTPPVIFICPEPDDIAVSDKANGLGLAGWFRPDTASHQVASRIAQLLSTDELSVAEEDVVAAYVDQISADKTPSELSTPHDSSSPAVDNKQQSPQESGSIYDTLTTSPRSQYSMPADWTPSADKLVTQKKLVEQNNDYILEEVTPENSSKNMDQDVTRSIPSHNNLEPVTAQHIENKLKVVRHSDYYAILNIRRGSSTNTVRDAFQVLRAQYSEQHVGFKLAHQFQHELAEIREALDDCWAVLGDESLREHYLQHVLRH